MTYTEHKSRLDVMSRRGAGPRRNSELTFRESRIVWANPWSRATLEIGHYFFWYVLLDSAEFAVFHHAAISCESKWISKRSYWSRIFFSLGSNREEEKNPGMVARRAFAATSSDGGSAGFMVLSQLLKQSQTSAV